MPYIFSHKQIDRGYHLFVEHDYNVGQVAEIMGTTIPGAWHLLKLVKQKYQTDKQPAIVPDKPKPVKKPIDKFLSKEMPAFSRPKAEYSNHSPMNIAS